MDANTLMQLAGGQVQASKQQAVDISQVMQAQQDLFSQAAALQTTNAAGLTPEQVRVAGIAELEAQNRTQAVAGAMGLSSNLQADLQVMLAQQWQQNTLASMQSAQEISKKESVGLLDNPLEYLFNQFTLQDDYTVYDGQVNAAAQAKQAMADLDSRVAAAKQTAANIATKVTDKTIADQLQAAENEIAVKKMEYQNKILGNEASRLEKVYGLGKDQFTSYYQMYQIANTEEAKKMQREQFARMLEVDNDRRAAKADKVAEEAEILTDIHRGELHDFGQALTPAATVKMHFGKQSPIGIQLQQRYEQGQRLRLKMPTQVAPSLLGRVGRFNTEPIKIETDAQQLLVDFQRDAVAAAYKASPKAKPEELEETAGKIVATKWEQWNRVIDPKDQTNPLAQLPLAAFSEIPALNETASWKLYKTAKQDKMDSPLNAAEFQSFLSSAVASGTVKLKDAAEALSLVGKTAITLNNGANKVEYFTGRTQKAYNIAVNGRTVADEYARILGPAVGVALAQTGVGAPVGAVIGGGLTAYGLKGTSKIYNISDPAQATQALLLSLPVTVNTSGAKAAGSTDFYPSTLGKKGETE